MFFCLHIHLFTLSNLVEGITTTSYLTPLDVKKIICALFVSVRTKRLFSMRVIVGHSQSVYSSPGGSVVKALACHQCSLGLIPQHQDVRWFVVTRSDRWIFFMYSNSDPRHCNKSNLKMSRLNSPSHQARICKHILVINNSNIISYSVNSLQPCTISDTWVGINAYGAREQLDGHMHLLWFLYLIWCKLLNIRCWNDYISPSIIFQSISKCIVPQCVEKKVLSHVDCTSTV